MSIRKIQRIYKSKPTGKGAGVHLKRAFGFYRVPQLNHKAIDFSPPIS